MKKIVINLDGNDEDDKDVEMKEGEKVVEGKEDEEGDEDNQEEEEEEEDYSSSLDDSADDYGEEEGKFNIKYNKHLRKVDLIASKIHEQQNGDGYFCCDGETEEDVVSPKITIKDIGYLSYPIKPELAQLLIAKAKKCKLEPGGDTTMADENQVDDPKTHMIPSKEIELSKLPFEGKMLDDMINGLGLKGEVIKEHFEGMIIQKPNCSSLPLKSNNPNIDLGWLIVSMPSAHIGGTIRIHNHSEDVSYSLENDSVCGFIWVGFYRDCTYTVEPITNGYRILLLYRLSRPIGNLDKKGNLVYSYRSSYTQDLSDRIRQAFDGVNKLSFAKNTKKKVKTIPTGLEKMVMLLSEYQDFTPTKFENLIAADKNFINSFVQASKLDGNFSVAFGVMKISERFYYERKKKRYYNSSDDEDDYDEDFGHRYSYGIYDSSDEDDYDEDFDSDDLEDPTVFYHLNNVVDVQTSRKLEIRTLDPNKELFGIDNRGTLGGVHESKRDGDTYTKVYNYPVVIIINGESDYYTKSDPHIDATFRRRIDKCVNDNTDENKNKQAIETNIKNEITKYLSIIENIPPSTITFILKTLKSIGIVTNENMEYIVSLLEKLFFKTKQDIHNNLLYIIKFYPYRIVQRIPPKEFRANNLTQFYNSWSIFRLILDMYQKKRAEIECEQDFSSSMLGIFSHLMRSIPNPCSCEGDNDKCIHFNWLASFLSEFKYALSHELFTWFQKELIRKEMSMGFAKFKPTIQCINCIFNSWGEEIVENQRYNRIHGDIIKSLIVRHTTSQSALTSEYLPLHFISYHKFFKVNFPTILGGDRFKKKMKEFFLASVKRMMPKIYPITQVATNEINRMIINFYFTLEKAEEPGLSNNFFLPALLEVQYVNTESICPKFYYKFSQSLLENEQLRERATIPKPLLDIVRHAIDIENKELTYVDPCTTAVLNCSCNLCQKFEKFLRSDLMVYSHKGSRAEHSHLFRYTTRYSLAHKMSGFKAPYVSNFIKTSAKPDKEKAQERIDELKLILAKKDYN